MHPMIWRVRTVYLTLISKHTIDWDEILAMAWWACGLEGIRGRICENIPLSLKADWKKLCCLKVSHNFLHLFLQRSNRNSNLSLSMPSSSKFPKPRPSYLPDISCFLHPNWGFVSPLKNFSSDPHSISVWIRNTNLRSFVCPKLWLPGACTVLPHLYSARDPLFKKLVMWSSLVE